MNNTTTEPRQISIICTKCGSCNTLVSVTSLRLARPVTNARWRHGENEPEIEYDSGRAVIETNTWHVRSFECTACGTLFLDIKDFFGTNPTMLP